MVNKELFMKIADQIERHPEGYDQGYSCVKRYCGTVACIGGWAMVLSGVKESLISAVVLYRDAGFSLNYRGPSAQEMLGLNDDEANQLFNTVWQPKEGLTVPQALRLIADGASVAEVSHG